MDELTVTLPPELIERVRRRIPNKPPTQAVLDLIAQALAQEEQREDLALSAEEWLQQLREQFRRSPLGRYIHAQAAPEVTLEEVLRITAKVKDSLAAEVVAEREDRL
jgi:hypothetical protein